MRSSTAMFHRSPCLHRNSLSWYIQMPLAAWQNQLKTPRERWQLCRWGDKTLRNNWQNSVQKSMNAKMEATTSENTFPSGQAMCTQMWRLRNGKEQAVSFLSLKIMLLLVFLNPSPFTQKCAFYLRNTFLPHESQNVVGSLWGYRELNWFSEGICSFC